MRVAPFLFLIALNARIDAAEEPWWQFLGPDGVRFRNRQLF